MSVQKESAPRKQRKRKRTKAQTYSARRQADRAERARRRSGQEREAKAQRTYRFRVKVVRYYRRLREELLEQEAVARTLERYRPREAWHLPLSISTIRRWHRSVKDGGYAALRPKSRRPHTIHYQVPKRVVGIIYTLRKLFGWGGHRMAAELKARGIWELSGTTVYTIFDRLGVPVKPYALEGRSDGIAYRRYEKPRPNEQWHIDLKHAKLSDGTQVYVCVIIDDHSRYAIAAAAGASATTEWVAQVTQEALRQAGQPEEMVSDNGREFVSVWEDSLTKFGRLLAEEGVEHLTCAPYYPQGNGKAEAFIKTLNRELLDNQTFDTLEDLQRTLNRFLTYYNNYRLHSAIGWQTPASRYTGRTITIRGLAGIPGIEPMATNPQWGESCCDPPIEITPSTAERSTALALVPA